MVDKSDDGWPWWAKTLIVLAIFGAIALVWWFVGNWPNRHFSDVHDAADFGGSFAFVESLFSGLAFAGVIIAILLQSQELRLQRKELEETRAELKKSAEAQKDMHKAMSLTAYLQATATLSDAISSPTSEADLVQFHSHRVLHTRLTAHLDWLLSAIRAGNIPASMAVDDRREMVHALNSIGSQWTEWWNAYGILKENNGDASNSIYRFTQDLQRHVFTFSGSIQCQGLAGEVKEFIDGVDAERRGSYDHQTGIHDRARINALAERISLRRWA